MMPYHFWFLRRIFQSSSPFKPIKKMDAKSVDPGPLFVGVLNLHVQNKLHDCLSIVASFGEFFFSDFKPFIFRLSTLTGFHHNSADVFFLQLSCKYSRVNGHIVSNYAKFYKNKDRVAYITLRMVHGNFKLNFKNQNKPKVLSLYKLL